MKKNTLLMLALAATFVTMGAGCNPATTLPPNSQPVPATTSSASQKSFKEYFTTREQSLNSGMNKNPDELGFNVLAKTAVTCPDSAGTPCSGEVLILSKDALHSGDQEFYLAQTAGFGYTYYGPFTDDLQRIVNESKGATLEAEIVLVPFNGTPGPSDVVLYKSALFDYSFRYRSDWFLKKWSNGVAQPELVCIMEKLVTSEEANCELRIAVNKTPLEKNVRENLISREEITFADKAATRITFKGDFGPQPLVSLLISDGDYTMVISYDPEDKNSASITEILDSFSFTQ